MWIEITLMTKTKIMAVLSFIRDCCSDIWNKLPPSELPFIPALVMGTLCSVICIMLLYKKHYKSTYWNSFVHMFRDIFITVPSSDHSEFMKCNIDTCIRCKRDDEVKFYIVDIWKSLKIPNKEAECPRIHDSVRKLSKKVTSTDDTHIQEVKNISTLHIMQKPSIFRMDLPANPIWTDLECYEVERELLKINYKIIKEEFDKIFQVFQNGTTFGWKLNHIPEGHWCIFPLIDQGKINEENIEKCPNTSALIGSFPSLMKDCVFGNACFSLLYPDSYIEPHYGPTNVRLRCHFGLHIPKGCWLEVDGTQLKWNEGECVVFDDSFQHCASFSPNKSPEIPRVILLLDFWHPSLSAKEKIVLHQILKHKPVE